MQNLATCYTTVLRKRDLYFAVKNERILLAFCYLDFVIFYNVGFILVVFNEKRLDQKDEKILETLIGKEIFQKEFFKFRKCCDDLIRFVVPTWL